MRPVALMSPNDRRAWRDEFTYLLGDDLLVAPVVEPGARERELFIPEGVWIDWWEGRGYRGPDVVTCRPRSIGFRSSSEPGRSCRLRRSSQQTNGRASDQEATRPSQVVTQ